MYLITAQWLAAPRAPARVAYVIARKDGRRALPLLAATRGVLQNAFHHLDVFDHTLLVLAGIEELVRDPLASLIDPGRYVRRVDRSLRRQGLCRVPLTGLPPGPTRPDVSGIALDTDALGRRLAAYLDPETCLTLKWGALLHDVGKPPTRRLSRNSANRPYKVQFLGHEVFGLHLLDELLVHLFPDPSRRDRLCRLIRYHHIPHSLVLDRYSGEARFLALRETLTQPATHPTKERRSLLEHFQKPAYQDFPLLILHGFADLTACRGPDNDLPLGRLAEVDLILLALWMQHQDRPAATPPDREIPGQDQGPEVEQRGGP